MRSPVAAALTLPLLAVASACGDSRDMDFGGRDIGPDLFSIVSTDGAVRMVLTDDYVYLALTDQTRDEVRDELQSAAEQEGAAGRIASFVERGVGKAMQFRALYPLDEIDDVRWEDGELRVEFSSHRKHRDGTFRVGDDPVAAIFDEESVREFGEEFRALKRERERAGRGR
jgi:hypothetical protein